MIHANQAAEDSFEQARQEFFGAKKKIIMPSADFLKTQNDNADILRPPPKCFPSIGSSRFAYE
jgi:hypothetical protein